MKKIFFNTEVKIAITAIIAIILLFFGLKFLKGIDIFKSTHTYYATFQDISGLAKSNPVYANGYSVGNVENIYYNYKNPGEVVVQIELSKDMQVPKGTTAELVTSMLGSVSLNLVLAPNPLDHISPGDTISGQLHQGALQKVEQLMPAFESMVPKLDSILTSLNALLADPAIAATLHNTADISANLKKSSAQLDNILSNDVPRLTSKFESIGSKAETLEDKLNALDIESTLQSVNQTVKSVNDMTSSFNTKINSKDNTMGLFLNDRSAYDSLVTTMGSANELLIDLRKHPKRYVHFSIFGKKDK